ncbi:uncharacterized protein BXZ73DRAFT_74865 [Epithele typhae]|uniref:uncharacterized protein n=1 Tax=Epithele typhae TaxID=378194 RepID=UPI0020079552|nr:uncharacterized protein BXZ73DRAFT_74865 [Epithele typhae]KAH9941660.1 hypothetical protein BXZ73DRAFT_74865 [Epithele typhae]
MASQFTLHTLESLWVAVGSLALVGYDYLLTLDREIKYIWTRKVTSASVIYVITRYCSLTAIVLTLLNFFPWPGKSSFKCNAIARSDSALDAAIILSSATFSSFRAYALCRRKSVAFLVFALELDVELMAWYSQYGAIKVGASYNPGPNNTNVLCDMDFSSLVPLRRLTPSYHQVTWKRTWPWKEGERPKFGLATVLFNDGVAYFLALLVANVINLAFVNNVQVPRFLFDVPPKLTPFPQLLFALVGWISATTVLFTCHFILDLLEAAARAGGLGGEPECMSSVPEVIQPISFRNTGGIGAPGDEPLGVYDAVRSEESESLYTYDYDFELQESPREERME